MQHVLTVLTYPGSRKSCFSRIPVFGRKVFLIFPIIYQTVDLKLICIIGQSDLINPLILLISTLDDIFTHFGGLFSFFMGQLTLKFHWDKICFFLVCIDSVDITNHIEITWSVMPKPVYLLTVQEAHKKYHSELTVPDLYLYENKEIDQSINQSINLHFQMALVWDVNDFKP